MARTPTGLASGSLIAGSSTIHTATDSVIITNLILTNTEAVIKEVSIFIDRGTSRLIETIKIPSGSGVSVSVSVLNNTILNTGDILSITSDSANINYDLSGWVIS